MSKGLDGIPVLSMNTAVVGFGAAALNAAGRLIDHGQGDIAVICQDTGNSTSRNAGSDKQTYYKLSLSGGDNDSVRALAKTLYAGECVDGDIALCEAALSAQCFFKLKELGVPFPVNRWGEYIGYKTDHDPKKRAASAGPLTSKRMVECLEKSVRDKGIKIYDGLYVVSIIVQDEKLYGLLCLNIKNTDEADFLLIKCTNVVWATGGPAGMYADSVYPLGHCGSSGIAFEAGAIGKNLTEWQFGMASLHPRWNVSGTYMQVLPRFISTEADGTDEREFLDGFFENKKELFTNVFLKGYQWPFDVRRAGNSSMIDILVYIETVIRQRKVHLDYTQNPAGLDFEQLSPEASQYLNDAGAQFGTPVDRLIQMNRPAYEFYLSKGVDLKTQPLQIAVCAQHNNGGLSADFWWHTNVEGLFAVGEACGSHGVYRPGGSALNAGQAGSMRAAQYIAANRRQALGGDGEFFKAADAEKLVRLARNALGGVSTVDALWNRAGQRMSRAGGPIRDAKIIRQALLEAKDDLANFEIQVKIKDTAELLKLFQLRDMLISQVVYLSAMEDYIKSGGKSRGSALYHSPAGIKPHEALDDLFTFDLESPGEVNLIQEVCFLDGECSIAYRPPRPVPEEDEVFENVWREYMANGNVY